jgi:hypothetical protein
MDTRIAMKAFDRSRYIECLKKGDDKAIWDYQKKVDQLIQSGKLIILKERRNFDRMRYNRIGHHMI